MQTEESAPRPVVLYSDDDILVINKPARLSSVPGVREKVCAKTMLERQYGELHVVHRLDLDTSGLLVFARNKRSLEHLNKSFRERDTHKIYEARLEGVISEQQASNSLWHSIGSIVRGNALSLKMAAERRRPQNLS